MTSLRSSQPGHVCVETFSKTLRLGAPYRGIETVHETLRIRVLVEPRGHASYEVVIDIDDQAVEVRAPSSGAQDGLVLGISEIEALFVVERQPRCGFLTWFGVFARCPGRADQLVLETPEPRVARFVERTIEHRLGLGDEPVRGEHRVFL